MAHTTTTVKVDDVQLDDSADSCVVRLPGGTAIEVRYDGWVNVYVNNGGEFSHSMKVVLRDAAR